MDEGEWQEGLRGRGRVAGGTMRTRESGRRDYVDEGEWQEGLHRQGRVAGGTTRTRESGRRDYTNKGGGWQEGLRRRGRVAGGATRTEEIISSKQWLYISYPELCQVPQPIDTISMIFQVCHVMEFRQWKEDYDPVSVAAVAHGEDQWVTYDTIDTIQKKVK